MNIASSKPTMVRRMPSLAALALAATTFAQYTPHYTVTVLHQTTWSDSGAIGACPAGFGGWANLGTIRHAILWDSTGSNYIDMNPTAFVNSTISAVSSTNQVGQGYTNGGPSHALVWSGAPNSYADLHPSGYLTSDALGLEGNNQVGWAITSVSQGANFHAFLWHGSSTSGVDLNPIWASASEAQAVSGNTQVGQAFPTSQAAHAVMWTGTSASVVDINPPGFTTSSAGGIAGNVQAGSGSGTATQNKGHALIWSGSAASYQDIHPAGFDESGASSVAIGLGVPGTMQAGTGWIETQTPYISHALLWNGSAASVFDLHSALAGLTWNGNPLYIWTSYATKVDSNGDVVGGGEDSSFTAYALLWRPIRTISGYVKLHDWVVTEAGVPVVVEIRLPGSTTPLESHLATLDANGAYSFTTNLAPGTYDIAAKPSHWLRQTLANQTIGVFGVGNVDFSLTNADCNGDNVVSLGDFSELRAAMNSMPGDPNWDPNADLNGDSVVSIADFNILKANFGLSGDN